MPSRYYGNSSIARENPPRITSCLCGERYGNGGAVAHYFAPSRCGTCGHVRADGLVEGFVEGLVQDSSPGISTKTKIPYRSLPTEYKIIGAPIKMLDEETTGGTSERLKQGKELCEEKCDDTPDCAGYTYDADGEKMCRMFKNTGGTNVLLKPLAP